MRVDLDDGQHVVAADAARGDRSAVANARGGRDRPFKGAGVYHAATATDARRCEGEDVIVVGGGNSAGQAAVHLSRRARSVRMVLRGNDVSATMSRYLLNRIERMANIEVVPNTEVATVHGNAELEAVSLRESGNGREQRVPTSAVFVMIGAEPCTDFVGSMLAVDNAGFVLCGSAARERGWSDAAREPYLLETVRPGVFVAGDVRSDSTKRVAGAVGDGALAVRFAHQALNGAPRGHSLSLDGVTTATVALEGSRRQRRGQIYVALAAVAWSTAGVLQRQLTLDTSTQVFGRAVFAGAALLAYVAVVERGRVVQAFRSVGLAGVAVALCVATASASFIAALNHTSVARVLFILAVAPVLAALLARVTLGEPITRRTVVAMALALAGVTLMLGAPGEGSLAGDGLSFVAALAFALMIVITRWRHDVSMAPATCLSQAILVAAFLPFASPGEISGDDVALAGGARHRPDRPRLRAAHRRRAADTGRAGGPDHAARGGARPAVGVARARRAPQHAHARRRRDRDLRDRHPDARGAATRAGRVPSAPRTALASGPGRSQTPRDSARRRSQYRNHSGP